MKRCRQHNIKLNKEKAQLHRKEVPFMGHVITNEGLKADPEKLRAVLKMPTPSDVAGVQQFISFTNYLSTFLPKLSEECEPLRKLTVKDAEWSWSSAHEKAVNHIKQMVTKAPVLKYCDPQEDLTLQCDASDTGLGTALLQEGQPIAFASRALTECERNYAQTEKELLAVIYGVEKFRQYTFGRLVIVHSDHKPLESIVKMSLFKAPKHLQRMLLQIQKYDIQLVHCKSTQMELADTLSRAYLQEEVTPFELGLENVNMAQYLPISAARLEDVRVHTQNDPDLQTLSRTVAVGWPSDKREVPKAAVHYFQFRDELSEDGITPRGEMLERIHSAHIRIEGCLRRARECLYWPSMSSAVKDYIDKCSICRSFDSKQPKETLHSHDVPNRPWARIGTDLFSCNDLNYLITVDYYSGFWEVDALPDTTSRTVINKLKAHFAHYGIPDVCISDNGPQFLSEKFKAFSLKWQFEHKISSPGYPQSNGKAEQAVKVAKTLMKKAKKAGTDPYLSLLSHRNTPTQGLDSSPVQRLMSRRTKALLPTTASPLKPKLCVNVDRKLLACKKNRLITTTKELKTW